MNQNGTGAPIKINSSNIELAEPLPHKVREEIVHVTRMYFGHLNHATVRFTREGHSYSCTINVQVNNLKMIVAEASAGDCDRAFDQALGKIGRRLHRRKQRISERSRGETPASVLA